MLRRRGPLSRSHENIRHLIVMSSVPRWCYSPRREWTTRRSVKNSIFRARSCRSGGNASSTNVLPVLRNGQDAAGPAFFPPEVVIEIKAPACQLPRDLGLPFSSLTAEEIAKQAVERGIVASWLNQVEIYFSILQRKILTPNDFVNLGELESRILDFPKLYEKTATAFRWKFTRQDLKNVLARLSNPARLLKNAA